MQGKACCSGELISRLKYPFDSHFIAKKDLERRTQGDGFGHAMDVTMTDGMTAVTSYIDTLEPCMTLGYSNSVRCRKVLEASLRLGNSTYHKTSEVPVCTCLLPRYTPVDSCALALVNISTNKPLRI